MDQFADCHLSAFGDELTKISVSREWVYRKATAGVQKATTPRITKFVKSNTKYFHGKPLFDSNGVSTLASSASKKRNEALSAASDEITIRRIQAKRQRGGTLNVVRKEKKAEVEGQPPSPTKRPTFKRWLKNTALIGSGYAVGHGLGMVAERGAQKIFGQRFQKWNTPLKSRLLHAGVGLAGAATFVAAENLIRQRARAEQKA